MYEAQGAYGEGTRVIDLSPRFQELRGCTLQWWAMGASHSTFIFFATGLPQGIAKLRFVGVQDVDCPTKMHGAHLRMASDAENEEEAFIARLTEDQLKFAGPEFAGMGFSPREGRLIIECDEGRFSLWAREMFLSWVAALDFDSGTGDARRPLWEGGPPLADL